MAENKLDSYVEIGKKKVYAGLVDWPGYCRSGRDEEAALLALVDYGPRYARVLRSTGLGFSAPPDASVLRIAESLEGNATTDFGAPAVPLTSDKNPVNEIDLERFQILLKACWQAFDRAVAAAEGTELRKGPRGGGRDRRGIIEHVIGGDEGYLSRLGWKYQRPDTADLENALEQIRGEIAQALPPAVRGELPMKGPRGGLRWTPRYFVRRAAWHVLDHTWEIEDRITPPG